MRLLEHINSKKTDAVLWQISKWMSSVSKKEPIEWAKRVDQISVLLSYIKSDNLQNAYIDLISKEFKIPKQQLSDSVSIIVEEEEFEDEDDIRKWMPQWLKDNKEMQLELDRYGFIERIDNRATGYYFQSEKSIVQRTNFVIKPLYHIYGADNKRMLCVTNGREEITVEMLSSRMIAPEQFMVALWEQGNYQQKDGFGKSHLIKIMGKYGDLFPLAYELNNLGWQNEEGFFAFSNITYRPPDDINGEGHLNEYDEYGVVKVSDKNYLSPSLSKSHERLRSTENPFENDNYLSYKKSPISFSQWALLMNNVYDKHGWIGTSFVIATLFRDIIMHITKIPHLYLYGAVSAGKSEFGESISNFFFSGKDNKGDLYKPMNLSQGTDYAFWNRMERFYNCPNVLNELDENTDEGWFRGIKSAYDGEGRTKGSGQRNRSITQKVNCSLVIMGQYLMTKDDNSVVTRSVTLPFKLVNNEDRAEKQVEQFRKLKEYENKGINGILLELLNLRPFFKETFEKSFLHYQKRLLEDLKTDGVKAITRMQKNFSCLLACIDIVGSKLELPFSKEEFYNHSRYMLRQMTSVITSSSGLSEFWSMLEFLHDRGIINEGKEYKVTTENSLKIINDDKQEITYNYPEGKMILSLRLSIVHKLYLEYFRKNSGKNGINEQTLLLYMKDQPYYLGWMKSIRYKTGDKETISTGYVFDYESLGINLIRSSEKELKEIFVIGDVISDAVMAPGINISKFTIREYKKDEKTNQINAVIYQCFSPDTSSPFYVKKGNKIQVIGTIEVTDDKYKNIDVKLYESVPANEPFKNNLGQPIIEKLLTEPLPF